MGTGQANSKVAALDRVRANAGIRLLGGDLDVESELDSVLRAIADLLGTCRVAWFNVEDGGSRVRDHHESRAPELPSGIGAQYHRHELPQSFSRLDGGHTEWAIRDQHEHGPPELRDIMAEEGTTAVAVCPGMFQGNWASVITLDYSNDAPALSAPVAEAVARIADLFAVAFGKRTDRREFENRLRRRQRLESIGLLAGGVAHDFNNALAVNQLVGHMLLEKLPEQPQEWRDDVTMMLDAVDRAADTTRRLLLFSRGHGDVRRVCVAGVEFDHAAALARRLVPESASFRWSATDAFADARVVCADLDQAILNLVTNAADAISDGGVVELTGDIVEPSSDGARYVRVVVRDDGVGMDTTTRERAREPLFTTKAPGAGTGLGLSTVEAMVVRASGWLTIDSEVGRGTTVTLCLPTTEELPSDALETGVVRGGDELILLAEDDSIVRRVTGAVLERVGYRVQTAGDGRDALAQLSVAPIPDLVVSDVVLPILGGRELCAAVTRDHPGLPVLLCSGYTAGPLEADLVEGPGRAFLPKPYSPEQLLLQVRALLDENA